MINVRVDGGKLRVRLTGWDAFAFCWRFSWYCEVPTSKIVRVYVRPARPALAIKSRTHWGPHLNEVRRVRAGRTSLWVDVSSAKYQRLAFSATDAEDLAQQIACDGIPIKVRHGEPGSLTDKDIAHLASGEFTRGNLPASQATDVDAAR